MHSLAQWVEILSEGECFICVQFHFHENLIETMVLYMSFDKFLLAFELRDLSQAEKSII